jgi:hypothetical protein
MAIGHVAEATDTTVNAVRKAIQRLERKSILRRPEYKDGRGGWSRYEVTEDVFQEMILSETRAKVEPKLSQSGAKVEPELGTQLRPTPSSSSSYIENNFKPTTTSSEDARARQDVWTPEDLDYSMLTDIGFGRSQAMQLRSLGLSFDVVQRSLVYFEFELRHTPSGRTIQEPLALLMKRMRQNGCWDAPDEYTKRQSHFRERFGERERQLQGAERGESNEEGAPAFGFGADETGQTFEPQP